VSTGKAIVLHAGLPKTGTTYLQQRFVDNSEWLAARGVDYPTLGRETTVGHHNLALRCKGQPVPQPWAGLPLREILGAVADGPAARVLLSSETFSSLHLPEARQLFDALGGTELTYVLYVRRRSALSTSRWQEEVKHGSAQTFPEYLVGQLLGEGDVLRIEDAVAVAAHTFGLPAVRIVVYDDLVARGIDLFEHFLERLLGLQADSVVPAAAERINASWAPALIEVLRALNAARAGPAGRAANGRAFVDRALHFLATDECGRALQCDVEDIFDAWAEPLPLGQLDQQWLHHDREILRRCRDQILNAKDEERLFPDGPAVQTRVLRPSVLHGRIPAERFAAACRMIDGLSSP
jgi:hypothetical protein